MKFSMPHSNSENKFHSDTKSFILRIWVESITDHKNPALWQGVVEQVGSSKRLYFKDLSRAFKFIQEQTGIGVQAVPTIPWWKSIIEAVRNASYLHRH